MAPKVSILIFSMDRSHAARNGVPGGDRIVRHIDPDGSIAYVGAGTIVGIPPPKWGAQDSPPARAAGTSISWNSPNANGSAIAQYDR